MSIQSFGVRSQTLSFGRFSCASAEPIIVHKVTRRRTSSTDVSNRIVPSDVRKYVAPAWMTAGLTEQSALTFLNARLACE